MTQRDKAPGALPDIARAISLRRRQRRVEAAWSWGLLCVLLVPGLAFDAAWVRKALLVGWAMVGWAIQARLRALSAADDEALASAVADVQHPADVPQLLECHELLQLRRHRATILAKLAELVPRMAHAEVAGLSAANWEAVRGVLRFGGAGPIALCGHQRAAVLAVLALVADAGHDQALAAVADVAERAVDGEVRSAARACAKRLQAVRDAAQRSGALLRPAAAPGETLLRPAKPESRDQLLRPVAEEDAP